jgi:hypothetical protein
MPLLDGETAPTQPSAVPSTAETGDPRALSAPERAAGPGVRATAARHDCARQPTFE